MHTCTSTEEFVTQFVTSNRILKQLSFVQILLSAAYRICESLFKRKWTTDPQNEVWGTPFSPKQLFTIYVKCCTRYCQVNVLSMLTEYDLNKAFRILKAHKSTLLIVFQMVTSCAISWRSRWLLFHIRSFSNLQDLLFDQSFSGHVCSLAMSKTFSSFTRIKEQIFYEFRNRYKKHSRSTTRR